MKLSNQYTSPDARFFYPLNAAIEHHESFDATTVPTVENIAGDDHEVVFIDVEGEQDSCDISGYGSRLLVGSMVQGIKGYDIHGRAISDNAFDYEVDQDADQLIVASQSRRPGGYRSEAHIVPAGEPLPAVIENDSDDAATGYALLGIINAGNKLVHWHGDTSYVSRIIDWAVIKQHAQNYVEEATLINSIVGNGKRLIGLMSVSPAAETYLRHFDMKRGTHYTPQTDFQKQRVFTEPTGADLRQVRAAMNQVADVFASQHKR